MPTLRHFTVVPRLPAALERLRDIALQPVVVVVAGGARALRPPRPRPLGGRARQPHRAAGPGRPGAARRARRRRRVHQPPRRRVDAPSSATCSARGGSPRPSPRPPGARIAYFSMEYGLHECLPIYSGGLGRARRRPPQDRERPGPAARGRGPRVRRGVLPPGAQRRRLAGRALPDQRLAPHARLPGARRRRASGSSSACTYPHGVVLAQLWKVQVGRVPLCCSTPTSQENAAGRPLHHRAALRRRPGVPRPPGDHAGHRRASHALEAVGLSPTVCHMNEGHSAFLALERIGRVMRERGVPFAVAAEANSAGNIFTTHTPVPAGNDAFDPAPRAPLPRAVPRRPRASRDAELLALGRVDAERPRGAVLDAGARDAHGRPLQRRERAARRGLAQDVAGALAGPAGARDPHRRRSPTACTRPSWVAAEMGALFTRYLGPALGRAARRRRALGARARDPRRRAVAGPRAPAPPPRAARAPLAPRRRPSGAGRGARRSSWPTRCSTRTRSPSASRAASRPTSGRRCSSAIWRACKKLLRRPGAAGAARLRRQGAPAGQGRQGAHSRRSSTRAATRGCAGAWSSSRTTTCASRARW